MIEYPIDFFYGVNSLDMENMKNWYQEMVTSGYLDIKNTIKNTNEFTYYFRHRILWEEIYDKMNDTDVYEIEDISNTDKDESLTSTKSIYYIPDVDIVFIDIYSNMDNYLVTKKGLNKLLNYTKPIKYIFSDQIKAIIFKPTVF